MGCPASFQNGVMDSTDIPGNGVRQCVLSSANQGTLPNPWCPVFGGAVLHRHNQLPQWMDSPFPLEVELILSDPKLSP